MEEVVFRENIEGIIIDRIVRDQEFSMDTKHVHHNYEIYYLISGERYYFIDNKTYLVKEGGLVLLNKGQIHKTTIVSQAKHDRILMQLDEEPFNSFLISVINKNLSSFFSSHSGVYQLDSKMQARVKSLLREISEEIHNSKLHYSSLAMMKLCSLLVYIMRLDIKEKNSSTFSSSLANTSKHNKVSEVASFIKDHPADAISLANLAERFYISKSYLSRIFKEVTGFTVNEYININRIKQAQELLLTTDFNISTISTSLGYESSSYFIRIFNKYMGTSPLQYRKQNRD